MSAAQTHEPRIGIVVVAYNAESTLAATLDRIPAEVLPASDEIIISTTRATTTPSTHGTPLGGRAVR